VPDRRPKARLRAASLLAALALTALTGCGGADSARTTSGFTESNPDGMHGAVLTEQYVVPEVSLTATDGSDFSLTKDTKAPLTLVFFGYTHCPDICQIVMADLTSAVARLDEADQKKVDVLFVTTDPARDDPKTLRKYLDRFNPRFEGLTGDLKTVVKAGDALGVQVAKGKKLPSGGYEVEHGTQVLEVDGRDHVPMVWTEGTPPQQIAEDLTTLLHRPESSPAS